MGDVASEVGPATEPARARQAAWVTLTVLAAWAMTILVGHLWGRNLENQGLNLVLYTPPILGGYRDSIPPSTVLPLVVGIGAVVWLPRAVVASSWRASVVLATTVAAVWWLSLGLVDGLDGLLWGMRWENDYDAYVSDFVSAPGRFLSSYVEQLPDYPIALRGHPPGFVMTFGALAAIGLSGEGWASTLTIAVGISVVPALAILVRGIADERTARRALPFVVLTPASLWIVTSTDAMTMAVGAWMMVAFAAANRRSGLAADGFAVAAGLAAAHLALQSYGMVLLAVPVVVLAWADHRWRPVVVAAVASAAAIGIVAAAGFWWFDGLFGTMHEYRTLGVDRPYRYFLLNNIAAWGIVLGPALWVAVSRLRDRRLWVIVGGGLGAGLAANVSGMSNGEIERIWLPFTALVLPAGAALWSGESPPRFWLGAQVILAVAVSAFIRTNW